mmetsp:Transcript_112333/g.312582  ORF Transcript_112333/g.312582 Transcript_112333/m.312582 type:complete len:215 (+) Transcript_112333:1466-2110(+)
MTSGRPLVSVAGRVSCARMPPRSPCVAATTQCSPGGRRPAGRATFSSASPAGSSANRTSLRRAAISLCSCSASHAPPESAEPQATAQSAAKLPQQLAHRTWAFALAMAPLRGELLSDGDCRTPPFTGDAAVCARGVDGKPRLGVPRPWQAPPRHSDTKPSTTAAEATAESAIETSLLAMSVHCSLVANAGLCSALEGKSNIPELAPPVRTNGTT